jgi:hypothetical protein
VNNSYASLAAGHANCGQSPIQQDFDPTVPNVARVYNCLLGGCFL